MPVVIASIPGSQPALARSSATIVRIVTSDPDRRNASEAVEFDADDVVIRLLNGGVQITPTRLSPDAETRLGFKTLFYPWGDVRQIKEYDREEA